MQAGSWTVAAVPKTAARISQSTSSAPAEVRRPTLSASGNNTLIGKKVMILAVGRSSPSELEWGVIL